MTITIDVNGVKREAEFIFTLPNTPDNRARVSRVQLAAQAKFPSFTWVIQGYGRDFESIAVLVAGTDKAPQAVHFADLDMMTAWADGYDAGWSTAVDRAQKMLHAFIGAGDGQ